MSAPVPIGAVIAERYRVDEVLGEGGMGVVVKATHLVLNQPVALKFLRRERMADGDAVTRFVREARAAAMVKSEHVVRVHDVAALEDGTPFIVMEYVDGSDLGTLLANQGPFAVTEAARVVVEACFALAETHAAGIVHGDLKPDNLYVTRATGQVKLLDFGISRIASDRTATQMGTPAYMAPERFAGGTIDVRSEIWALGAVLYEMLSGAPPFAGTTAEEIRDRVLHESPARIARDALPPELEEIVRRCLASDRSARFADAVELARALEPFAPERSAAQRMEPAATRIHHDRERRHEPTIVLPGRTRAPAAWIVVGVVMALALALASGAAVVMMRTRGGDGTTGRTETTLAPAAASAVLAPAPDSLAAATSATSDEAPVPSVAASALPDETHLAEVAPSPPRSHTRSAPARSPRHVERASRAANAAATPPPATPPATDPPPDAPSESGDRFGTRK